MLGARVCFELDELVVVFVAVQHDQTLKLATGQAQIMMHFLKETKLLALTHHKVLVINVVSNQLVRHVHQLLQLVVRPLEGLRDIDVVVCGFHLVDLVEIVPCELFNC